MTEKYLGPAGIRSPYCPARSPVTRTRDYKKYYDFVSYDSKSAFISQYIWLHVSAYLKSSSGL